MHIRSQGMVEGKEGVDPPCNIILLKDLLVKKANLQQRQTGHAFNVYCRSH